MGFCNDCADYLKLAGYAADNPGTVSDVLEAQ
jgi:hypothetical protein